MEWVVYLLLFSATLYTCVFITRVSKKGDDRKMSEEIDQDFSDEFEVDQEGELTGKGMEDMLDWLEEQEETEESQEIEGFEELKDTDDRPSVSS